jgi:hypothetical protein
VPNYQNYWGFDVDPKTGAVAYVAASETTDIELLHLVQE